jgi:hypothetical protein
VLAGKLVDALPGMTTVEYSGGRFGKRRRAERVSVDLGDRGFILTAARGGITAEVVHTVRGVRLSGRQVELDEWLHALAEALTRYGATESRGREVLNRLLG